MQKGWMERKGYRALLLALGISGLYFMVIYLVSGFHYAINDDMIMRNISSGRMTGTPDGHLIFAKYVWGWLVAKLYSFVPTVDWYGLALEGTMLLSLALLLNCGLRRKKTASWKAGYALFVLLVFTSVMVLHVILFEWTLAAAAAGASAVFIFFAGMPENDRQVLSDEISVAVLLVLAFNIRSEIFIMVCPALGLFYVWSLGEKKKDERWRLKNFRMLFFIAAPVTLTGIVEAAAYASPEWNAYGEWNEARSEVMDYYGIPNYEGNEAFYDSISVMPEEVRNLRHYALYLTEGMDSGKMEQLADQAKVLYEARFPSRKARVMAGVKTAWEGFFSLYYFPVNLLSMGALLLALWLSLRHCKAYIVLCILIAGAQGVLWLYLGVAGRLPERVAFSMHVADLAFAAAVCMRLGVRDHVALKRVQRVLLGGLFLGLAVWSYRDTSQTSNQISRVNEEYQNLLAYLQEQTGKVFFLDNHMEASRGDRVSLHKDFSLSNSLTLGDWYSFSPLDDTRMESLRIEKPGEALVADDRVCFVSDRKTDFAEQYLEKKYGKTDCEIIETIEREDGFLFTIYQFHKIEGE